MVQERLNILKLHRDGMDKKYILELKISKLNWECTTTTYNFKILKMKYKPNTKHEIELKIIKLGTWTHEHISLEIWL